ncbi:MAG: hypothetical protein Q9191_000256 [Dirinaria sp. TL-2023a]
MHLAISLYVGLLYVLPCAITESQPQREILTYQYSGKNAQQVFPQVDEITIDDLQQLYSEGSLNSYNLVQAYLERIRDVNSMLHAVGEINPDALAIASSLDAERAAGSVRGPLHGVPILVKDNIATQDKMNNTSGSYALLGATVSREATVVSKLRDAGAIILGKATMGEWAQCRSRKASSSHGWSAYGGQVYGAYYPQQDPSGSSSGSAVAVSVGLALGSLATETSGSIVLPAERNNVVGIKPTLGLTSRSMVIPISLRQDTVGPMAKTVKEAAYLLSAIAGMDSHDNWTFVQPHARTPNFAKACRFSGLKGARIGVPRNGIDHYIDDSTAPMMAAFEDALQLIGNAGAWVVENTDFAAFDPPAFARNSSIVLDTDFISGLAGYLSQLSYNPNDIHSLHDVARYTKAHPSEEYPDRDTYVWDRQLTRNISSDSAESWEAYQANLMMAEEQGVIGSLDRYNLDALVMPTFASFHLPAIAGLPVITVPLGFTPPGTMATMNLKRTMVSMGPGIPFGLAFVGRRWSEETLIALAYAFEQRTMTRKQMKPLIAPSFELGHHLRPTVSKPSPDIMRHVSLLETVVQPATQPTLTRYSTMQRWARAWLALVDYTA